MKIVFCINELDPGGAERALVRIASGLQKRGHECRVISLRNRGQLAAELEANGVSVAVLNRASRWSIAVVFKLARELRKCQPDVLQCFLPQANFVGRLAAWFAGVPVVLSGIRVADRRSRTIHRMDWLTRCLVTKYVAVSKAVAEFHAALIGLPEDAIVTIRNGVDFEGLNEIPAASLATLNANPDERLILCVARLDEQKAPEDLLTAFQLLPPEARAGLRLRFLGDGPLRKSLETEVARCGLQESVHLDGYRSDAVAVMKRAFVLVLPSLWEGLPNVVLEAMAVGLPVIATAVDGTTELIEDRETGRLVPPGEPGRLAAAISDTLVNPGQTGEMAHKARQLVQQKFSWADSVSQYEVLYRHLVAETTADPRGES